MALHLLGADIFFLSYTLHHSPTLCSGGVEVDLTQVSFNPISANCTSIDMALLYYHLIRYPIQLLFIII